MNDEQQAGARPEEKASGTGTSAKRTAELQSWIDNVIVPILVQEILKTRRKVREDLGVTSDQS